MLYKCTVQVYYNTIRVSTPILCAKLLTVQYAYQIVGVYEPASSCFFFNQSIVLTRMSKFKHEYEFQQHKQRMQFGQSKKKAAKKSLGYQVKL